MVLIETTNLHFRHLWGRRISISKYAHGYSLCGRNCLDISRRSLQGPLIKTASTFVTGHFWDQRASGAHILYPYYSTRRPIFWWNYFKFSGDYQSNSCLARDPAYACQKHKYLFDIHCLIDHQNDNAF